MRNLLFALALMGCSASDSPQQSGTAVESGALCSAENAPMPACAAGACGDCLGMGTLATSDFIADQGELVAARDSVQLRPTRGYHLWHVQGPGTLTMRSSCFAPWIEVSADGNASGPLPSVDGHFDSASRQFVASFALDAHGYSVAATARDNVRSCPTAVVTGSYSIALE